MIIEKLVRGILQKRPR